MNHLIGANIYPTCNQPTTKIGTKSSWYDAKFCMMQVKSDGMDLRYIKHKTIDICIVAIDQNPKAIKFLPPELQTAKMYLRAIKVDANVINDIPKKHWNESLYMPAVRLNGFAINFVPIKKRTKKLCLAALKQNIDALVYIEPQTPELVQYAIESYVRLDRSDDLYRSLIYFISEVVTLPKKRWTNKTNRIILDLALWNIK